MEATFPVTERTRVRRLPQRASHERATVHDILDAGLVCHVGLVADARPIVIPTAYARVGDHLVLHGSTKNRTLLAAVGGAELCIAVTLLDGLVLARSAFHHSVQYRSVVLFGHGTAIDEPERKRAALEAFTDRLIPGRWAEVRPPTEQELRATLVVEVPIVEAVAKVRTGPPLDDAEDLGRPVWAGILPLAMRPGSAEPDEHCIADTQPPRRHWPFADAAPRG